MMMTPITSEDTDHDFVTAGDAAARRDGYTRLVYIEGGDMGGEFLIQPDTDLDAQYRAWGVDWQEWTTVCGWNVIADDMA